MSKKSSTKRTPKKPFKKMNSGQAITDRTHVFSFRVNDEEKESILEAKPLDIPYLSDYLRGVVINESRRPE